jgi:hypothetical protein
MYKKEPFNINSDVSPSRFFFPRSFLKHREERIPTTKTAPAAQDHTYVLVSMQHFKLLPDLWSILALQSHFDESRAF